MPHRLDVGQHFTVDLHVSGTDAVVGEQYQLVTVPALPPGALTIDTHTVEIKTLEADGSAILMFGSMDGFQVAGLYKLAVIKTSSLTKVSEIKCEVVLLPVPLPSPGPGPSATGGGTSVPPVIVDQNSIAAAIATAIASCTPTPPAQSTARRFINFCLSWIPAILIVLAVLAIFLGILGMPFWAVWYIAKNGNSQHGQSVVASAGCEQVVNPICKLGCSALGNLCFPKP